MRPIRVLVVEDSVTVRKRIVEVLSADHGIEVVGEAADGRSAVEQCRLLRPDVVSLDMILPVMSGLAVTEFIMACCPTPILIVSSSTNRSELFKTYDALASGALDVFDKPDGGQLDGNWERAFVERIHMISRIRVIRHIRPHANPEPDLVGASTDSSGKGGAPRLVAIGSSTGGPRACAQLLRDLPADFPLPILLVIHIGSGFASALAEWLDGQSHLRVRCATHRELLPEAGDGLVLLAPADMHLSVAGNRLLLSHGPERHSCRPSVDVLFESVARELGAQSIGCLLTGMGKDGAEGLLQIRQAGGRTLAQDKTTSTIFGMPGEAVRLGAAEAVVPIEQMADELVRLAGRKNS